MQPRLALSFPAQCAAVWATATTAASAAAGPHLAPYQVDDTQVQQHLKKYALFVGAIHVEIGAHWSRGGDLQQSTRGRMRTCRQKHDLVLQLDDARAQSTQAGDTHTKFMEGMILVNTMLFRLNDDHRPSHPPCPSWVDEHVLLWHCHKLARTLPAFVFHTKMCEYLAHFSKPCIMLLAPDAALLQHTYVSCMVGHVSYGTWL